MYTTMVLQIDYLQIHPIEGFRLRALINHSILQLALAAEAVSLVAFFRCH